MPTNADQLPGTLDLLVLKVLAVGPQHGHGIAVRLHQLSADVLRVEEGSLYPALYRIEQRGWIRSAWVSRITTAARGVARVLWVISPSSSRCRLRQP